MTDPTVIYSWLYLEMTKKTTANAEIENWLRIRVRFFPNVRLRVQVRKKNAESYRSGLRRSESRPTTVLNRWSLIRSSSWSANFLKIISPFQSWSAHIKSCIFMQCPICLIGQKHCWSYLAFSKTHLIEGKIAAVVLLPRETKYTLPYWCFQFHQISKIGSQPIFSILYFVISGKNWVQMHCAWNRDTHLYPPRNNSSVYLTTTTYVWHIEQITIRMCMDKLYNTPHFHPQHQHPPPRTTLPKTAWVRFPHLCTGVGRFHSCLYKWAWSPLRPVSVVQKNKPSTMSSSNVQSNTESRTNRH